MTNPEPAWQTYCLSLIKDGEVYIRLSDVLELLDTPEALQDVPLLRRALREWGRYRKNEPVKSPSGYAS